MPTTPLLLIPYPAANQNPWTASFGAMVNAIDASLYTPREDRNIIISGGGVLTFVASSGVLTWAESINLLAAVTGYQWSIPAGQVTLNDGQLFYITVARAPQNNTTYIPVVGSSTPNQPNGDNQILVGIRIGSVVHFRDGFLIGDGQSKVIFDNTSGGSGGITQLTGDAAAGPGSGSQAIEVKGLRGISVPSPSGTNTVLTYNAGTFSWEASGGGSSPFVQPGGTGTVIEASDTTAPFSVGDGSTVPQISTTGGQLLFQDTSGDIIILNDGSVEIEDANDDLFEMGGGNITLTSQDGDSITIGFGAIDLDSTAGGQLSLDSSGGASLTSPTLIQFEDGAGDTIEMSGGYVSVGSSNTTQLTLSATTSLAVTAPEVVNQPTTNNGTITNQISFTSTDAAQATQNFAIPASSAGRVDVIITGANGVDAGNATWSGKVMDLSGTVTVFKSFAVSDEWDATSGASAWTVSVAVVGTNVAITVQGSTGAGTINWTATLQYASTAT